MATFCIPPLLAEKLKAAAVRGEIDIEKMYDMNSSERRAVFEAYVDGDTARQINLGFEKAMVSKQVDALGKWVNDTFVGKNEPKKKKMIDKITELSEEGVLTPQAEQSFYEDLVSEKLGLTVTAKEAEQIHKLSQQLQAESGKETEFGTPTLEYFKIRRKMQDYIDSINPSPVLKVLSSIIGRGNMLARVSSPFLNIESNTLFGAVEAFSRRLETRRVGGLNNEYAIRWQKYSMQVYTKTGYDMTRMLTIEDDLTVRGEDIVQSQGEGTTRQVGRFYEDVIFKGMQGTPDVLFAGFAFADRANIESTKQAGKEGLKGQAQHDRALKIFQDATRIDPQTKEGKLIREAAIADAMYSTYTNKSIWSEVALGIRKVFNIASGDARLGDQIMPFVKTPANVIGAGINMSGIGVPIDATFRLTKVLGDMKNGKNFTESVQNQYAGFWKTMVQAGLGITIAHILSSLFDPEDFIGEYPTSEKERQLLTLENATTNSVKIGDRWISLDYFGPIGTPLTGILYAKKYGTDMPSSFYNYIKGSIAQVSKLPGFENSTDLLDYLNGLKDTAGKTINDEIRDVAAYAIGFGQSRLTPGIVYDLSKMTDTSERTTKQNEDLFGRLKSAFPGFRQTLSEKRTVYADIVPTEPAWSTLLFGSRVKTAKDDHIIQELKRLDRTGNLPSITDVSKTSPRARELKRQIGNEKFEDFMIEFGTKLKDETSKKLQNQKYKNMSDSDKKQELDKTKNKLFDNLLDKYNFQKE